jgi:hypothetical protein
MRGERLGGERGGGGREGARAPTLSTVALCCVPPDGGRRSARAKSEGARARFSRPRKGCRPAPTLRTCLCAAEAAAGGRAERHCGSLLPSPLLPLFVVGERRGGLAMKELRDRGEDGLLRAVLLCLASCCGELLWARGWAREERGKRGGAPSGQCGGAACPLSTVEGDARAPSLSLRGSSNHPQHNHTHAHLQPLIAPLSTKHTPGLSLSRARARKNQSPQCRVDPLPRPRAHPPHQPPEPPPDPEHLSTRRRS